MRCVAAAVGAGIQLACLELHAAQHPAALLLHLTAAPPARCLHPACHRRRATSWTVTPTLNHPALLTQPALYTCLPRLSQEARNILDFYANFENDPSVKIPWVRRDLSGPKVLVMEWIDGIRCTDVEGIKASGIDLPGFIRTGVVSGLRQLLEFGLFHGDPHPGEERTFCQPPQHPHLKCRMMQRGPPAGCCLPVCSRQLASLMPRLASPSFPQATSLRWRTAASRTWTLATLRS